MQTIISNSIFVIVETVFKILRCKRKGHSFVNVHWNSLSYWRWQTFWTSCGLRLAVCGQSSPAGPVLIRLKKNQFLCRTVLSLSDITVVFDVTQHLLGTFKRPTGALGLVDWFHLTSTILLFSRITRGRKDIIVKGSFNICQSPQPHQIVPLILWNYK